MLCVKNDVVKMDWEVDGFIDNRSLGFLGAVHDYHGVAVAFEEGVVYTLVDDEPLDLKSIVGCIKESYGIKKGKAPSGEREFEMDEYSEYLLLVSGVDPIESNIESVGLTPEDVADIMLRIQDLEPYFREIIVD